MAETKIILTHSKSTKGTHVYANPDAGFPNIYFPKELPIFKGLTEPPANIEMSLKVSK